MPGWVLDWVVIHELAHLEVPDHGDRFQALVARYELGERAKGYLMAKSEGRDDVPVSC
jgi:predicted metal-dependent hydrolase